MSTADGQDEPMPTPGVGHDRSVSFEIRLRGCLGSRWTRWFDGFQVAVEPDGTSVLRGPVADQAALHGLLQRLRDLGIPIVALTELPAGSATGHIPSTPQQP